MSAHLTATKVGDKAIVAETTSGADGRFTLPLPTGDYVIVAEISRGVPVSQRQQKQVSVTAHTFTRLTFVFDSGIRAPMSSK